MISSREKQALPQADAFGNVIAFGRLKPNGGLILNTALPQKLYPSVAARGAGTNPLIPLRDPEVGVLRGKVIGLEKQFGEKVGALENQVAELQRQLASQRSAKTVALSSLGSSHYRLRQTLWAALDASGDAVTAHVPELEEYGTGVTEYEALDDLRSALLDTYTFLLENETKLGPAPTAQLRRFRDLLEKI
ncbi:MAG: hypothetical protein M3Z54_07630 [Gemmatimonadota bacterium]|nr:hypothetical protein [Gemmatimonadota bacterium]